MSEVPPRPRPAGLRRRGVVRDDERLGCLAVLLAVAAVVLIKISGFDVWLDSLGVN